MASPIQALQIHCAFYSVVSDVIIRQVKTKQHPLTGQIFGQLDRQRLTL